MARPQTIRRQGILNEIKILMLILFKNKFYWCHGKLKYVKQKPFYRALLQGLTTKPCYKTVKWQLCRVEDILEIKDARRTNFEKRSE